MFSILSKLIKAINSNHRSGEIAAGISMSLILGFIPSDNLIWFILLIIILMIKIHIPTMFAFLGIFKLITPLYDPLLNYVGIKFLSTPNIQHRVIELYNKPFMFLTDINSSLVIGGIISGVILWIPVWFLSGFIIKIYRKSILPKIKKTKFYAFYKKIPIVSKLSSKASKGVSIFGGKI